MQKAKIGTISLLLAVFISVLPTTAIGQSANQPFTPFRIIGNIYYVGDSDVTSYLITTSAGHILLDSGYLETASRIKTNIVHLGFRLEDVKILLNSHAHFDHAGGLALLKEATGAKLFVNEAGAKELATADKDNPHWGNQFPYAPVTADRILRDGEKVELGGVTMIGHQTPGHTRGNTTWAMQVKDGVKTYNVVFAGSVSTPSFKLVDNAKYPNIVADYEKTFRVMKSLPCDVFLSSHAQFFDMKTKYEQLAKGPAFNPFIDAKGYSEYVRKGEQAFKAELQKQQAAK